MEKISIRLQQIFPVHDAEIAPLSSPPSVILDNLSGVFKFDIDFNESILAKSNLDQVVPIFPFHISKKEPWTNNILGQQRTSTLSAMAAIAEALDSAAYSIFAYRRERVIVLILALHTPRRVQSFLYHGRLS